MAAPKKTKSAQKKTAPAVSVKKPSAKTAAKPFPKAKKVSKPAKPAETVKAVPKKPAAGKPAPKAPSPKKATAKKAAVKGEPKRDRLGELRKALIVRREAIVREAKEEIVKYISGENRQLVDTALDEGDWAVVDISEDLNLNRLAAHRKTLHNIDEALRKIGEGTYGICEECGEEISEKRLSVLPTATLCISCQENKEQFEAIGRGETE